MRRTLDKASRCSGRCISAGTLALVACLVGCGGDTASSEPSEWMLGTFSNASGSSDADVGQVTQNHVHDDLSFEAQVLDSSGVVSTEVREWKPVSDDEFHVLPNEHDADVNGVVQWIAKQTADCGVLDVEQVREHGSNQEMWYRGATCVRAADPCPPEDVECRAWNLYWCDGAPDPCPP